MVIPYNQSTEYLFIDGGSLRGFLETVAKEFFPGETFEVGLGGLPNTYTKIFYYDAFPVRETGESEEAYNARCAPQQALFSRLRVTNDVHVYEGDARRRRKRGLEQKMVDVMLTVDMLMHTFRRNMQRATLLTGDQDFKPLVDALISEGMYVTLWYPPGETNPELSAAADRRRSITLYDLYDVLTIESRARFVLPHVENVDPSFEFGVAHCEWYDDEGRLCSFGKISEDWFFARVSDQNNRLTIRHRNALFALRRAEEVPMFISREARIHLATQLAAAPKP